MNCEVVSVDMALAVGRADLLVARLKSLSLRLHPPERIARRAGRFAILRVHGR